MLLGCKRAPVTVKPRFATEKLAAAYHPLHVERAAVTRQIRSLFEHENTQAGAYEAIGRGCAGRRQSQQ